MKKLQKIIQRVYEETGYSPYSFNPSLAVPVFSKKFTPIYLHGAIVNSDGTLLVCGERGDWHQVTSEDTQVVNAMYEYYFPNPLKVAI